GRAGRGRARGTRDQGDAGLLVDQPQGRDASADGVRLHGGSPYNAQVRRLRQALQAAGLGAVPVGTVDKFQGLEAPVVFYSMATSSAEAVPRTLDFLFSRNRLNVAVSRAMNLAFIVASPRLLESHARTVEQMRLINALCRFAEMAGEQTASVP